MTNLLSEDLEIQDSDIAIISMSGRFPGANTIEQFWKNLRNGVESISNFSDSELLAAGVTSSVIAEHNYVRMGTVIDGIDQFDASFFGFNPKEAAILDPQHRLFLECAWEVLEQAGYVGEEYNGLIGLYAGGGMSQYLLKHLYRNPALGQSVSNYQLMLATEKDFLPTRVAYKLNLTGPTVNVQTACSTSLVAVHLASQALLNGDCDLALAGGVSLRLPQKAGYLYQEGMIMSPDGHCRAFDAQARGTIGGSGAGVVLLKLASEAIADRDTIHALIKGSAINNDGAQKVGFTAPSVDGQAAVIAEAQALADVSADTITCIEAHGTGTELGDPIELKALTQAFRQTTAATGYCAIGSVKTNVGHLDTAAGVAGLIKTVLALQHRQIPPSLHFQTPNPKIDFANSPFFVNTALRDWLTQENPRRAGVSSFGIGGTNAHVVLEEAPISSPRQTSSARPQLLVLSAKTESALAHMATNLANHLQQQPDLPLVDVAYTLSVGRRAFPQRQMLVATTAEDAVTALRATPGLRAKAATGNAPVIFLFPGQGSQYVNMGRDLYEGEPVFREYIDRCAAILEPTLGLDLRVLLYPEPEQKAMASQQLNQTAIAQPALFTVEYALAQLWQSWGIDPIGAIGHSIGEYVAACLAGVFELEAVLRLVATRGRLIQELPPGRMLSVPMTAAQLQPMLRGDCAMGIAAPRAIAAINEEARCVVSGPVDAIADLESQLTSQGIESRPLHTSHAFHSPMMEPILKVYGQAVAEETLNPPQIPFISSVTGTWITAEQATDPYYWSKHLRSTVQFAQGLEQLLAKPTQILLEVGPGRTLSTFAKRHSQRRSEQVVVNSMRHPQENVSDMAFALQTLGQLWLSGSSVDWSRVYSQQTCYRIPLPTYPFERQRYWIEQTESYNDLNSATGAISTAKFSSTTSEDARLVPSNNRSSRSADPADWFYLPSWKRVSLPYPLASTNSGTCWLVFLDPYGVGVSLVEALQAEGETVCVVEMGDNVEKPSVNPSGTETNPPSYRVNPGRAEDYQTLMQDLKATGYWPTRIVHLWTVTATPTLSGSQTLKDRLRTLETIEDMGFYSLVFLAQALGKHDTTSQPCQLTVISNGMQEVIGGELNAPEKAIVLGPVQIIPKEYPHITCRSIDLDFDVDDPVTMPSATKVLAELRTPITEPAIAYRGGYRWVRTFEQVPLPAVNPDQLRLKPQGVYLITGGLGGIGLEISTYLAQTVQAKLVLISRSPMPPRATWLQWLADNDSDNPTSQKIRKVQEMEDLGAEVLICCADVTDYQGMERAIAQAHTQFGGIHGVIHGAGVAGGGLIQLKTRAIATETMACKLQGTLILDALLQDCELDFVVLFSTLNTVQPAVGQVDYCAANAFLDAFAWAQNTTGSSFTISINWDGWQEVGLAAAAARNPRLAHNYRNFDDFLSPAEGVEAFARILHQPFPQVLVSTTDLQVKLQETRSEFDNHPPDHTPTPTKASLTTAASTPTTTIHSRPNLSIPYIAPRNHDEQTVVEIWQNILGIEPIGINDSFLELGGDSLIAIQIVTRLRKVMATHLSVASLFETPTIAMLVASVKESRQSKSPTPDSQSNEREEIEL